MNHPKLFSRIYRKTKDLKIDLLALWFAYRDGRTPWYSKLWAAMVVGYAFSPIDLIPDFIPVLGYVDDIILLPLGIWVAIRLVPGDVLRDSRRRARIWFEQKREKPKSWTAGVLIVLLWIMIIFSISYVMLKGFI